MRRSDLSIQHVDGSFVAFVFAALLTAGTCVLPAFCQATYTVNEPLAPKASPAVASLLTQVGALQEANQYEEALRTASRVIAAALEAKDPAGEALSDSA